jgi:hypothetical protein
MDPRLEFHLSSPQGSTAKFISFLVGSSKVFGRSCKQTCMHDAVVGRQSPSYQYQSSGMVQPGHIATSLNPATHHFRRRRDAETIRHASIFPCPPHLKKLTRRPSTPMVVGPTSSHPPMSNNTALGGFEQPHPFVQSRLTASSSSTGARGRYMMHVSAVQPHPFPFRHTLIPRQGVPDGPAIYHERTDGRTDGGTKRRQKGVRPKDQPRASTIFPQSPHTPSSSPPP